MKKTTLAAAALLTLAGLGGCASPSTSMVTVDDRIYLTTLGLPATPESSQAPSTTYRLGAGDALGEAIFSNYLAFVRATFSQRHEVYVDAQAPIFTNQ